MNTRLVRVWYKDVLIRRERKKIYQEGSMLSLQVEHTQQRSLLLFHACDHSLIKPTHSLTHSHPLTHAQKPLIPLWSGDDQFDQKAAEAVLSNVFACN